MDESVNLTVWFPCRGPQFCVAKTGSGVHFEDILAVVGQVARLGFEDNVMVFGVAALEWG